MSSAMAGIRAFFFRWGEKAICASMPGRSMGFHTAEAVLPKGTGSFVIPVVLESVREQADCAVALEDDRVVVLHKEASP